MDTTTHHTLAELFAQLGLPNSLSEMHQFVVRHRALPLTLNLSGAPFWTPSQVAFLREHWQADDGDWALQIDELNALLREHPDPEKLQRA